MSTVYVGLSGGVDSAVSAALLKEAGHSVTGVFIKIWQPEFIECTWKEDRLDAMRVCAALDIPFREVDLSEEYKQTVIRDMIEGYARGITPNPDVLCNRTIKFGSFATWAFENGAEKIATGHYARIEKYGHGVSIFRGKDGGKDQSYFLWQLTEKDLSKILFPVGSLRKNEVRSIAVRLDLPVAKKPDSQGLCFVGHITMSEFLKMYIPLKIGLVLDEAGKEIGRHEGAALYTIGQRHGFSAHSHGSSDVPQYVIATDIHSNTITVSRDRMRASRARVRVGNVHWTSAPPKMPLIVSAQVRYREDPTTVTLDETRDFLETQFAGPVIVAPGQSIVFYDGDRVLGGGIIE